MHTIHSHAMVTQYQHKVSFSHSSLGCGNSTTHLFVQSLQTSIFYLFTFKSRVTYLLALLPPSLLLVSNND